MENENLLVSYAFRLSADDKDRARRIAKKRKMKLSVMARIALEEYMARAEKLAAVKAKKGI